VTVRLSLELIVRRYVGAQPRVVSMRLDGNQRSRPLDARFAALDWNRSGSSGGSGRRRLPRWCVDGGSRRLAAPRRLRIGHADAAHLLPLLRWQRRLRRREGEKTWNAGLTDVDQACMADRTSAACARSSTWNDIVKIPLGRSFRRILPLLLVLGTAWNVPAYAARYLMPSEDAPRVGETLVMRSKYEDTLATMAQRYGLGYRELVDANPGVDPWLPGEGTPIVLPMEYLLPPVSRDGVVLNLPEFRLYYFPKGGAELITFPIGIGRSSYPTPRTDTKIVTRVQNPTWYPGENARREYASEGRPLPVSVPAGPDNPMGSLALVLGIKSYFIHGTNKPFGVGQQASFGCVRLYPADIEDLGSAVPNGTRVRIIDVPTKVAWVNGELYLEVHKKLDDELTSFPEIRAAILAVAGREEAIDWSRAEEMAREARGIPGPISIRR